MIDPDDTRQTPRVGRDERRRVLRCLGAGAVLAIGSLLGCRAGEEGQVSPGGVRVPLADLPPGARRTVRYKDLPVELSRQGERIVARSLQCTHTGCIVVWNPARHTYDCPCHDGRFDADGRPLYGPPTKPLDLIAVHIAGGEIVVG
jgi:Rieske Fe-S protein